MSRTPELFRRGVVPDPRGSSGAAGLFCFLSSNILAECAPAVGDNTDGNGNDSSVSSSGWSLRWPMSTPDGGFASLGDVVAEVASRPPATASAFPPAWWPALAATTLESNPDHTRAALDDPAALLCRIRGASAFSR